MVFKYVKFALFAGFALLADAKKGKYGYRKNVDKTDEIVNSSEDDIVTDSWGSQKDSRNQNADIDVIKERLQKNSNSKKSWKKQKKQEKDFARGVLEAIFRALPETEDPKETIELGQLVAMFDTIVGDKFKGEGNKALERGFKFGEKRLYNKEKGCRDECRDAPWAEGCQQCCITIEHVVDWNCDSTDESKPPAMCCTEWSAECYTKDTENNHNHACKDCYGGYRGYEYGGYGGHGGFGPYGWYGPSNGDNTAGWGGGRDGGYGYIRGRRRAGAGYGRY